MLSVLGLPVPPEFSGTAIDLAGGAADIRLGGRGIDGSRAPRRVRTALEVVRRRLYDLEHDPRETRDMANRHPDVERNLAGKLVAILRSVSSHHDVGGLDRDLKEKLKTLGYVSSGAN